MKGKIRDQLLALPDPGTNRGIKEGRTTEALLSVIEKCGAELKRSFPQSALPH